jgi:mono/diheme cytochrome c family protein
MSKTIAAAAIALLVATCVWAADGAALFKGQCAKCHGDDGKADTPVGKALKAPALAGDASVAKMSDADLVAKIKGNAKHASFVKALTDADLSAVAAYVKQLAGK